jgi:hypothetical protein
MAVQRRSGDVLRNPAAGRVGFLVLLAVLMVAVLAGVLWASGMGRRPGNPAVGQPEYALPDHSLSSRSPPPG